MELNDLFRFIEVEDEKLKKRYDSLSNKEEVILARTVKLGEEFGELCEEVLAYNSLQRRQKLDNHDKKSLREEFADVIITALLLAKSMNVNIEMALEKKMQKLNQRV
ncbi:MAG: MazG nucleotide pyrophosphohydrolase domain-containing protein [Candidatus Bathyarchaeia archaeon]